MMTFYDKNGYAVCYTMDNIHLYSFDGYPLAYFHAIRSGLTMDAV